MTSWLITGGTGSFGHAFTCHLLDDAATERVVIYSRDELKQAEMRTAFGDDPRLRFFVGTVDDEQRITEAMEGVEYVVHAAAMKRVEVCEDNPWAAVLTNVIGTRCVARACKANNVRKAVFLSTDKAAAPFTSYGVTKLQAERLWLRSNVYTARQRTRFSATRYGNVIGSRGSVVQIFERQALEGGPLTVTHPEMTRFWMRMAEAVALVDLALHEMRGGEVFVPKIAASSVLTLAEAIAPGVPTVTTGLRPGEKIHETLICEFEARDTYDCGDHYRIEPESRSWERAPLPAAGEPVPAGFTYTSECGTTTADDLRELIR